MNLKSRIYRKFPLLFIVCFFLLIQGTVTAQENFGPRAHPEMEKMKFLIGEWQFNGRYPQPDGTFGKIVSRSSVNVTMGGRAIADHFSNVLANGEIDNVGITVRTYNAQTGKWKMFYVNQNLGAYTNFTGTYENGEFHFDGKGVHGGVEIMEKVTFFNIKEDSYSWNMDRSFDGGKTWIKSFYAYDAVRVE